MNPDQLRRARATHFPKDRVLIVGSTALHQAYSRWILRRIDQHPGLFEEIDSDLGPEQILREAAKIARKQRAMGSECQQVWVLLDGISANHAAHLLENAKTPSVSVVTSTPDFRTWMMLHLDELLEPITADSLSISLPPAQPFAAYETQLVGRFELAKARALALEGHELVHTDAYKLVDGVLRSTEGFHGHPHGTV